MDESTESTGAAGIRLNKLLANAGLCSRRGADEFIKDGKVKVNGKPVFEMGFRVMPGDQVTYLGKNIAPQPLVYVLLNKPKDVISTVSDERGRKTVMDLLQGVYRKLNIKPESLNLYPVGRLDRHTTGLLLFTTDGELAEKLSHPRNEVEKIYHVWLDKPLHRKHIEQIGDGLVLEDGPIKVDSIAWPDTNNHKEVGVELHSGRNRIVRRIFESLGYEVEKLDRVVFAGLTKKDLPRGRWRFLTDREIRILKHFRRDPRAEGSAR